MSDQLEDSHEFMHLRRKNTETINDLEMNFGQDSLDLFRKERKLSLISNLSNCSNRHI